MKQLYSIVYEFKGNIVSYFGLSIYDLDFVEEVLSKLKLNYDVYSYVGKRQFNKNKN